MPVYEEPTDGVPIEARPLCDWTARLLEALGTPPDIAADVAEVLVASDRRGIASHGTARLPNYVALVEAGVMDPLARPVEDAGRGAFVRFDGRNGWGHHAGRVATDRAISLAATYGVGVATMHNTNHYGIAGWYALRAAERGLVGLCATNTSPVVAPTRARQALIGTNPIAIAAPAGRFGTFCLDMATSVITRGRSEVAARRGERLQPGWAIGLDGRPATDPETALEGALQPLGGAEETGGYKGYGLALAVDLLTGILAGAAFGPNIVGLFSLEAPSELGQTFLVLDPAAIDAPGGFERRLEAYWAQLTSAPTIPGAPGRVLIPGEPETDAEQRAAARGIVMDRVHAGSLVALGERFEVPFPIDLDLG